MRASLRHAVSSIAATLMHLIPLYRLASQRIDPQPSPGNQEIVGLAMAARNHNFAACSMRLAMPRSLGGLYFAWARFEQEVRTRVRQRYLEAIAAWRHDHGHRLHGEFVIVAGVSR